MNEMVCIGKSVSTFGIKGELKVISDFEYLDKAYKVGKKVLINNIMHEVSGVRYHKKYVLLKIDNINDINDILEYVGFNIYIRRMDLGLENGEYLYKDLIGAKVMEDGVILGCVKEVIRGANKLLKVSGENNFYIPLVSEYITEFIIEEKILVTKNAKDLII